MSTRARGALLAVLAATSAGALVPEELVSQSRAARPQRPNVLLIITDDQRHGTLNVMPHTRRLFVRGGRSFARGFVTTPLCCPSRASIYTGRYAHNHGVRNNNLYRAADPATMIQRHLDDAGYLTGIVGKYLQNPTREKPPNFDRWASWGVGKSHFGLRVNENGTIRRTHRYSTTYIRRKSLRFLKWFERRDATPWFLVISTKAPHEPFVPHPRHRHARVPEWTPNPAVVEEDRSDKPPWVRSFDADPKRARTTRNQQLRMLKSVDGMVSAVFQRLDDVGESRRTLALYISDNGYLHGDHGLMKKRFPYTYSIKVPLMMRWPARVGGGTVGWRWAANIDIAPTIADAAGLDSFRSVDGHSLLGPHRRRELFVEFFRDEALKRLPDWAAIRDARKQYIEYYRGDRVVFREYYDLTDDPWQLRNVLSDGKRSNNPDVRNLSRRLRRYRTCSGAGCP